MSNENDQLEKQIKLLQEKRRLQEESQQAVNQELADARELADELLKTNKARQAAIQAQEAALKVEKENIKSQETIIKTMEEEARLRGGLTEAQQDLLDTAREELKVAKLMAKEEEESLKRMKTMDKNARGLVKTMTGVSQDWESTWWGAIVSDKNAQQAFDDFAKSVTSALNPIDMMGSLVMKLVESTMLAVWQFDTASASLAAATGQGTRYNDMIMDVADANRGFGVGMDASAQSIQALSESMSGFTQVSNEAAAAFAGQAARLERLGVAASTTGKINDQLMKGMGMTADQAMKTNNELARAAMGIGVPVGKMAQEFENALPQLAAWGNEAPKIFKKVAGAAKALGVEMNTLLGFASQFDTFEGAATAVGKLNNILGGDMLNTYDMINASEEKRNEMLLQSIESSGKSWKTMSRYEKMALANAAGINDMAEANKLFGGGLSVYKQGLRDIEANAVAQKELEERTQAAVSVKEKFMQVVESIAIAVQPLVTMLHGLVNGLLAINDITGGMLVPVLAGLIGVYYLLWKVGDGVKEQTEELTEAQLQKAAAEVNAAAAAQALAASEAQLAAAQLSAAKACDKKALCDKLGTVTTHQKTVANKGETLSTIEGSISKDVDSMSQTKNTAAKNVGIIATLRLAAANALNTVKTWAAVAAERAIAIGRMISAKAAYFLSGGMFAQASAQTAVGATAPAAAAGTGFLSKALGKLAHPKVLLGIAAVALLAAGLGLVAIGVGLIVNGFAKMVQTFAEVPHLIVPIVLGLYAIQIAILAMIATMPLAALALAGFANIMAMSAPMIVTAAVGWGAALWMMAPPFLAFSVALLTFAVALNTFTAGAFASMAMLAIAMPFFAQSMLMSAIPMALASVLLAPAMVRLAIGFAFLAGSLFLMAFSIPAMALLSIVLPLFAMSLLYSSVPLYAAALIFPAAAILLSIGLAALGLALLLFDTNTAKTMALLGPSLVLFGVSLLFAAPALYAAAGLFMPAALLVGLGLFALGFGLLLFDKKSSKIMSGLAGSLILFAISLVFAAPALYAAGLTFTLGALAVAAGLFALGLGLLLFDKQSAKIMKSLAGALILFSMSLVVASPFLYLAASIFTPAAFSLAIGLLALGLSLKAFNKNGIKMMEAITIAIIPFAMALWFASPMMLAGGVGFGIGALLLAPGLILLGLALRAFPDKAGDLMLGIAKGIIPFAFAVMVAAPMLHIAGKMMLVASLLLAPALAMLAAPLLDFATAMVMLAPVALQLPMIAAALALMGPALIIFAISMIAVGIAASMPFFSTGIGVFKDAIASMATSFEAIPTEKAKAMGQFFESLAKLTDLNNVADVMWSIAGGIYGVSAALAFMPTEKAFALSEVVSSVTEAAIKVTPEGVENVTDLVEQAAAYADVQAKFKAPSVDAFVQALKQVNEGNESKGAKGGRGKDIVLELNGRELGRAVDAHLDDKHNLISR